MIVKITPSKGAGASFGGLSNYLLDKLGIHKDKVEDIEFSNCEFDDIETNIEFIEQIQSLNYSKSDKTLHLIVSFQEDEKPSKETLRDIEKELLRSIGMEHHQRLSVTHANTNNYHLHIAVSRIDPDTYKRIDPFQSKRKLDKKMIELEEKYNLKKDNHIPNWKLAEQDRKSNNIEHNKENNYEPIREQHSRAENRRLRIISQSVTNDLKNRTKTGKRDSMRKLSDIDMVHNKKLAKVLLSADERNSLRREEQGLADNQLRWERQSNSSNVGSTRAVDIQSHTGITNLTDWIRDNALVDIKAVLSDKNTSLEQLHTTLAKYNLELKERGNGLIIKDKSRNLFCKASDIDRNLSKNHLAKLYGSFTAMDIDIKPTIQFGTPKNDYWDKYKAQMDLQYKTKKEQSDILRDEYDQGKSAIQAKWRQRIETLKSDKRMNKRIKKEAYQKIFENQRKELRELYENYTISKSHINKENRQITYKDYLISESLKGDDKALEILRKQKPPKPKEDENTIGSKIDHRLFVSSKPVITKLGFVVYKLDKQNDNSKIIDKGNHLKVSNASDEALLRALEMAKLKYGSTLDITGDNVFKTKVISLVQKHNLDINFKDKGMQKAWDVIKESEKNVPNEIVVKKGKNL